MCPKDGQNRIAILRPLEPRLAVKKYFFQFGIGGTTSSRNEAKVKYSIETPGDDNNVVDENVENQDRSGFCVLNFLSGFLSPGKLAQKKAEQF